MPLLSFRLAAAEADGVLVSTDVHHENAVFSELFYCHSDSGLGLGCAVHASHVGHLAMGRATSWPLPDRHSFHWPHVARHGPVDAPCLARRADGWHGQEL